MNPRCAYLAPADFVADVQAEIARHPQLRTVKQHDGLFLLEGPWLQLTMSQASWKSWQELKFQSISEGAKQLKELGKLWHHFPINNFRRAELIGEQLHLIKSKPIDFLSPLPKNDVNVFSLIDEHTILALTSPMQTFPLGTMQFNEDKINPPSRAYLKLWEVFTVHGVKPKPGELCIDMGSCPGGWTWVLQTIGAKVISVDKAPLEERIGRLPNITFRQESAFGLRPQHVGPIDWFFSDIICYPQKLYDLVKRWIDSGLCKRFVCTIKFQKTTDFEAMEKFLKLAPSRIVHLHHNKHEVTWIADLTSETPC